MKFGGRLSCKNDILDNSIYDYLLFFYNYELIMIILIIFSTRFQKSSNNQDQLSWVQIENRLSPTKPL